MGDREVEERMMSVVQVVSHVWATKKEEKLNGRKLLMVRKEVTTKIRSGARRLSLGEEVGAEIGEMVLLVVSGSAARRAIRARMTAPMEQPPPWSV